jgi:pyrimidine oxygenase
VGQLQGRRRPGRHPWLGEQGAVDKSPDTNVRQLADPTSAVNLNMGTLVGSYASVARMLDEMAEVPGTEGVLMTFDHFVEGVRNFGERIQPLMKSRVHVDSPVPSQVLPQPLAA